MNTRVVRGDGNWRVTYKGHLLGTAISEEEGWLWVEDMRKMEERGEYDPVRAERERVRHLTDSEHEQ